MKAEESPREVGGGSGGKGSSSSNSSSNRWKRDGFAVDHETPDELAATAATAPPKRFRGGDFEEGGGPLDDHRARGPLDGTSDRAVGPPRGGSAEEGELRTNSPASHRRQQQLLLQQRGRWSSREPPPRSLSPRRSRSFSGSLSPRRRGPSRGSRSPRGPPSARGPLSPRGPSEVNGRDYRRGPPSAAAGDGHRRSSSLDRRRYEGDRDRDRHARGPPSWGGGGSWAGGSSWGGGDRRGGGPPGAPSRYFGSWGVRLEGLPHNTSKGEILDWLRDSGFRVVPEQVLLPQQPQQQQQQLPQQQQDEPPQQQQQQRAFVIMHSRENAETAQFRLHRRALRTSRIDVFLLRPDDPHPLSSSSSSSSSSRGGGMAYRSRSPSPRRRVPRSISRSPGGRGSSTHRGGGGGGPWWMQKGGPPGPPYRRRGGGGGGWREGSRSRSGSLGGRRGPPHKSSLSRSPPRRHCSRDRGDRGRYRRGGGPRRGREDSRSRSRESSRSLTPSDLSGGGGGPLSRRGGAPRGGGGHHLSPSERQLELHKRRQCRPCPQVVRGVECFRGSSCSYCHHAEHDPMFYRPKEVEADPEALDAAATGAAEESTKATATAAAATAATAAAAAGEEGTSEPSVSPSSQQQEQQQQQQQQQEGASVSPEQQQQQQEKEQQEGEGGISGGGDSSSTLQQQVERQHKAGTCLPCADHLNGCCSKGAGCSFCHDPQHAAEAAAAQKQPPSNRRDKKKQESREQQLQYALERHRKGWCQPCKAFFAADATCKAEAKGLVCLQCHHEDHRPHMPKSLKTNASIDLLQPEPTAEETEGDNSVSSAPLIPEKPQLGLVGEEGTAAAAAAAAAAIAAEAATGDKR
ncbi:hypothetical protein Emag_003104 [Eimeria magna]